MVKSGQHALSVNFEGFKFESTSHIIKLEKIVTLFTKRKGTHDELKEFGSPLHAFIGKFINENTEYSIYKECKHSLETWCNDFHEEVEVSVKRVDATEFVVRVSIDAEYIDIDSHTLYT